MSLYYLRVRYSIESIDRNGIIELVTGYYYLVLVLIVLLETKFKKYLPVITVSNIGAFGVGYRFSTVIINQPQSAILGIG